MMRRLNGASWTRPFVAALACAALILLAGCSRNDANVLVCDFEAHEPVARQNVVGRCDAFIAAFEIPAKFLPGNAKRMPPAGRFELTMQMTESRTDVPRRLDARDRRLTGHTVLLAANTVSRLRQGYEARNARSGSYVRRPQSGLSGLEVWDPSLCTSAGRLGGSGTACASYDQLIFPVAREDVFIACPQPMSGDGMENSAYCTVHAEISYHLTLNYQIPRSVLEGGKWMTVDSRFRGYFKHMAARL
ncbi:Uncharacterised protein [Bordetella ansorpii]|uniref:Lipoprotein n=1 Tax=Bordetella ansorpii TaxID=288768 RepID=A0A157PDJ3_9BORD|nr:hypothetical protein [Bordetella ansorpii]SAI31380.1 Uncharacterised protein [Bordetella ansorpii]